MNRKDQKGLKTFPKGGIHPPEHKYAAGSAIQELPLPKLAIIPLSQHVGAPAQALVKRGDLVKVGTLIGQAQGFISANIHSSVSGKVQKVEEALGVNGYKVLSVFVEVEGDVWEDSIDTSPELVTTIPEDSAFILKRVQDNGIVGMGGATFPAHVKLGLPPGKSADTLIIDGVECEPYLTADHRLMLERPDEILIGTRIMMQVLGVSQGIIGIEANKGDAIELLRKKAAIYPEIRVEALQVKYPQGGEKQLIKALLNREVPSGKLPLDVGCVVNNVGTSFAVYNAVQKNMPLVRRIMTVTSRPVEGRPVVVPYNFCARIGTPAQEVLAAAGADLSQVGKVINGGPMMGRAASQLDFPVTKGTSGLVLMHKEDCSRRPIHNCIRCGKCITVCPMGLEPYLLEKMGEMELFERAEAENILDCMECGSCSFICPSGRPILDYIRWAKNNIIRLKRQRRA